MILLDTHAWVWWRVAPDRLSAEARAAIEADGDPFLSAMSVWEVSLLHRRGRLEVDRPLRAWLRAALMPLEVLPLEADVAVEAALLPDDFPRDPADRLIYATARSLRCRLVTADREIRAFDPASTVW